MAPTDLEPMKFNFCCKEPLSLVIAVFLFAVVLGAYFGVAHGGRTAGQVVNDVEPSEFAPVGK